jgi:hypothetical protein
MPSISAYLDLIPAPVTYFYAALGAVWIARKFFSYVGLLADLFFLKGTNVSFWQRPSQLRSTF